MSKLYGCLLIAPIITTALVFAVTIAFSVLASRGLNDLFVRKTSDVSDKYATDITPADWTFTIWIVIYVWDALWIAYGLSTLCRKGIDGEKLYKNPLFMPPFLYVFFIASLVILNVWLFTWDREYLIPSFVLIAFIGPLAFVSLIISYRAISRTQDDLIDNKLQREVILVRLLVQNGLALFVTWVAIATHVSLAIVLIHEADVSTKAAGTIALSILSATLIYYFFVDIAYLDRHGGRYTFTPYFVFIFALSGILAKNYEQWERNTVFVIVLLAISGVTLVIKSLYTIYQHFRHDEEEV